MTLSVVFFIDLNLVLHRDLFVQTWKLTSDLKLMSRDRYWRRWGTARVTDLWSAQAHDLCFFLKKTETLCLMGGNVQFHILLILAKRPYLMVIFYILIFCIFVVFFSVTVMIISH